LCGINFLVSKCITLIIIFYCDLIRNKRIVFVNNVINTDFGCKNPVQSLILIIKIINLRSVVFSYCLKAIFELISTKLVFCSFQMTILFYKKI
jgi:hypothetical protein